MQKPLTLRRRDMIEKVCDAINESALPAFVVRDALKAIDVDLARLQEEQLKADTVAWNISQKKAETKESKKPDDNEEPDREVSK